jgi:hypothetical protein
MSYGFPFRVHLLKVYYLSRSSCVKFKDMNLEGKTNENMINFPNLTYQNSLH